MAPSGGGGECWGDPRCLPDPAVEGLQLPLGMFALTLKQRACRSGGLLSSIAAGQRALSG